MSSKEFETFYREIFADLSISREESAEIKQKFIDSNPPPDKLVWLRSAAFRIGSEFLSDDADDADVALLRSINAVVHALELTCMNPIPNNNENDDDDDDDDDEFDEGKVEEFYREIYADLTINQDEKHELVTFFKELSASRHLPASKLIWTRAAAFRIATEFLTVGDDKDKDINVSLLKCINSIVHALEVTCMTPKPFTLKVKPPPTINIDAVGVEESISKAAQYLWDLDVNRLQPNIDYKINVQGGKKPYWKEDQADDPLFTFVNHKILSSRPTYKSFIALLDNYNAETGNSEYVSTNERNENWAFLRSIMQSGPMQFCHRYCIANAKDIDVPSDERGFMKLLYSIWFDSYKRDRNSNGNDSSGFEHVFIGEIKNEKVSGFHNWITFYREERSGHIDYRGYIKPRNYNKNPAETNDDDHVLTIQFHWDGIEKAVGTSFIGVSPEFEMALYTMCFLVGEESNVIRLDTGTGDEFELNCKVYRFGGRDKISTSFVEALEHYD